jgi:hypothetical protein
MRPPDAQLGVRSVGAHGEFGLRSFVEELARLQRRALRRPILVSFLVLLLVGAVTAQAWRRVPLHRAEVVLRVTDSRDRSGQRLQTPALLRGYLERQAFSDANLLQVMGRHGLADPKVPRELLLARVRDMMGMRVEVNPFLRLIPAEQRPVWARVVVTYAHRDPDVALGMARDMGRLAVAVSWAERRTALEGTLKGLRASVEGIKAGLAKVGVLPDGTPLPGATQTPSGREDSRGVQISVARLGALERALAAAQTRMTTELEEQPSNFELLEAELGPSLMSQADRALLAALISLLFAIPIAILTVGAFDPSVHDDEDVRRMGLEPLGRVPLPRAPRRGQTKAASAARV